MVVNFGVIQDCGLMCPENHHSFSFYSTIFCIWKLVIVTFHPEVPSWTRNCNKIVFHSQCFFTVGLHCYFFILFITIIRKWSISGISVNNWKYKFRLLFKRKPFFAAYWLRCCNTRTTPLDGSLIRKTTQTLAFSNAEQTVQRLFIGS